MLTSRDTEEAFDLAKRLLHAPPGMDFATDVLEPVASALGADMAAFREVCLDSPAPRIRRHASAGVPERLHSQYLEKFYKLDPAIFPPVPAPQAPPGASCVTGVSRYGAQSYSSLTSEPEARRRYLTEFLAPNRLLNGLSLHIRSLGLGKLFLLDFHRPSSALAFSDRELWMAQMICPAVQLLCTAHLGGSTLAARQVTDELCLSEFDMPAPAPLPGASAPPENATQTELTDREREIARAVTKGFSNKEIARHLGISVRTAENHLRKIYRKCDVHSRTQLASRLMGLAHEDD